MGMNHRGKFHHLHATVGSPAFGLMSIIVMTDINLGHGSQQDPKMIYTFHRGPVLFTTDLQPAHLRCLNPRHHPVENGDPGL